MLSTWSQSKHSNVRLSWLGLSGSMRANIIRFPHFGQGWALDDLRRRDSKMRLANAFPPWQSSNHVVTVLRYFGHGYGRRLGTTVDSGGGAPIKRRPRGCLSKVRGF
jgi:hypothetical protein